MHATGIVFIVSATVLGGMGVVLGGLPGSGGNSATNTRSSGALAMATSTAGTINSSISPGFNAVTIPSGDAIWFAAVIQLTGGTPNASDADSQGLHIHFVHQTLEFTGSGGVNFTKFLPDGIVEFSKTATVATTVFDSTNHTWFTTVPIHYTGDVFLSGYSYYVGTSGLPGGTHVTWSGEFLSSECAFQFNWKWAATVYTHFAGSESAPNYSAVGVKPVDDNHLSVFANSDHAGTPEHFRAYLAQGARGGGGANFTGSYSGTVGVKKSFVPGCVST